MAPASTGSDMSSMNAVTSIDQANSGILCIVMPGARMLKMVVMKLIAPRIDEAPDKVDRQDDEIDGGARLAVRRIGRIERPAAAMAERAGRSRNEHRRDEKDERRDQQPERDVVQARESHIRRADHDRHEPVAEAADQRRHDDEEDHHQPMRTDDDVVERSGSAKICRPGSCSSIRITTDSAVPRTPAMIENSR